jgi:alpha 1,2-mannosyltransferase
MTSGIISGKTYYGQVPADQWSKHPSWIDEDKAKKAREEMIEKKVIYGDSVPYRKSSTAPRTMHRHIPTGFLSEGQMCRFFSGFFYRHPLLEQL